MPLSATPGLRRASKRAESEWVIRKLNDLIATLASGDRLPGHKQLMTEFGASERVVLHALSLLQDAGRITRRNGKGTFVAEQEAAGQTPVAGPSLTTADSRTVVSVAQPDHSFFDRCLQVLYRQLEVENLQLVSRLVSPESARQFALPSAEERPLAFILFRSDLTPLADRLQADGNRVVLVGSQSEAMPTDVPTVYSDHTTGGQMAAGYLIACGHRRIAYAGSPTQELQRVQGHERAVLEARHGGLNITDAVINREMQSAWAQDPGQVAAFFRRPAAPTGIAVWNDHEAAALLVTLTRAGVRVPEEVSLIGYDNVPESTRVHPALTTIDAGIPQIVRLAVELATGALPPKRSQTVMVVPTLVVRDSTAAPEAGK